MNKVHINELLTHPAFIGLIVWATIICFLPPLFIRYKIKRISDYHSMPNTYFYYYDLDSDGSSELVSVDLNDDFQTKIIVKKDNRIIDQYDLKYHPYSGYHVYSDDYNMDGFYECYVFTMSTDSIFLNIFEPLKSGKFLTRGKFIDFRNKAPNSDDSPKIVPVGFVESANDKNKDFIFYINTGYSRQPRNVYRYNIEKDSLFRSPKSGAAISESSIFDIDGDKSPEILIDAVATGNFEDDFPYSDQYSWLMVLNKSLEFHFPPVRIAENPSRTKLSPINLGGENGIVLFSDYSGSADIPSCFYLFDSNGKLLRKEPVHSFENGFAFVLPNEGGHYRTFYFMRNRGEIDEMDQSFKVLKTTKIPDIGFPDKLFLSDIDLDGKKEYIFKSNDDKNLIVLRENIKHPVSAATEKNLKEDYYITRVLKRGNKPLIYLQFKDFGSYYKYEENLLYFLKYPLYALFYLLIYFFIIFLSRVQKYRLNIKLQTERKIAELQMKSIKNQIDPHFTLNILNAIGSLYATEENRERADYIFGKYARLIKQTVISSDQIIVTLEEEIDFVRNFIDIEKFRLNDSFKCSVDIDDDIDLQIKIPRMLIYTFVENGIKYGVRNRQKGGLLKILVRKENNSFIVTIEDNGPGIQPTQEQVPGTGRGLKILNELVDLYQRLEKVRITYSIRNVRDEDSRITGTMAVIIIPLKN